MQEVNAKPPNYIVGIEVFNNDVRVIRRKRGKRPLPRKRAWYSTPEGEIFTTESLRSEKMNLSKRSQKHLAFVASNTNVEFDAMVTLTYPEEYPMNGKICKRHLHAFLAWLRRKGVTDYLWFMEFQKRGAPHFHVLINGANKIERDQLSLCWFNIVDSRDEKHLRAGTRIDYPRKRRGLSNYCIKYAQKASQKAVPPGFRDVGNFWNCSNTVRPVPSSYIAVDSEEALSSLLKGWQYEGREKDGFTVLYNAADTVRGTLSALGIDVNSLNPET